MPVDTDVLLHYPNEWCPCRHHRRQLQEDDIDGETWEIVYTSVVLFFMFAALVSDRIGADSVMIAALTLFMVAEIITVSEGLAGFSNQGLLTVMVLFVVAEGIGKTGALDWYLGKILGSPTNAVSAQLRLMIPVGIVSAFLNNTPVVTVMIPIVQRWAHNCHISQQQLLVPLSFASILGGTCTLIGTSTNLVVEGLLNDRYNGELTIGLFDLGKYGVPVAICGLAYVVMASPWLLPGGQSSGSTGDQADEVLLGARLLSWSPAAGRTVKRSGLRDTGGIYLVSVQRAITGNVHRAVSSDFVVNAGDILYFTGLIESFGEFCDEQGLEMLTNEIEQANPQVVASNHDPTQNDANVMPITEVGVTKESLLEAEEDERMRSIVRLTDMIRGIKVAEETQKPLRQDLLGSGGPATIVATVDRHLVVVGINAPDRPGLLLDVSKSLVRLNLNLHHAESSVIDGRSLSIWRCEGGIALPDVEEIWSVLNALLSSETGVEVIKKRGQRVIRVEVTKFSDLIGKRAQDVDFRGLYKAAIIVIQKGGKNVPKALSSVRLDAGDVLILQVSDDSPLLVSPPDDFYANVEKKEEAPLGRSSRVNSLVNRLTRKKSTDDNSSESIGIPVESINIFDESALEQDEEGRINASPEDVWKNLMVLKKQESGAKEFLTAMQVAKGSKLAGKSIFQSGISKLPDVFLVSIDRPITETDNRTVTVRVVPDFAESRSIDGERSVRTENQVFHSIVPEEALQEGDVLWFAGSASAVGDLRKIPGMVSYQNDEVVKMKEKVHDRRLVQAVVARKGPLVGKTVSELRFRTRYGAAVIAVHREGKRVHEHPGRVKLQAGDVLLLEAGTNFLAKAADNNRSFALLSEVENSAPPRISLLIPSLIITAGMIIAFTTEITSLLVAALVASILMIALGILSEQEARDAMNWEVYLIIASAFGIGTALVNSGVAGGIADFLVNIGTAIGIGDAGVIGAVYFATFLISNVVTNNAAAALLFPVAIDAAEQAGIDRIIMSFSVMLGASASFMTPFGYTTNLLIYGPGGYKYMDFVRFGTPMQLFLWVASVAFLALIEPWYISWIATTILLIAVLILRLGKGWLYSGGKSRDNSFMTETDK